MGSHLFLEGAMTKVSRYKERVTRLHSLSGSRDPPGQSDVAPAPRKAG